MNIITGVSRTGLTALSSISHQLYLPSLFDTYINNTFSLVTSLAIHYRYEINNFANLIELLL